MPYDDKKIWEILKQTANNQKKGENNNGKTNISKQG